MNSENNTFSLIAVTLIFASSMIGLYAVSGIEHTESDASISEHELIEPSFSEDEIVKTFYEISDGMIAFFDDLREEITSQLIQLFQLPL